MGGFFSDLVKNTSSSIAGAGDNASSSLADVGKSILGNDTVANVKDAGKILADNIRKRYMLHMATGGMSLLTEAGLAATKQGVAVGADQVGLGPEAPPPAPPPVPVMPAVDSEAVAQARKRQIAAMKNRGGRSSTILTGGSDTLGG